MLVFLLAAMLGVALYAKRASVKAALFPLAYHLYASTPLGLYMHRRQLSTAGRAPHSIADRLHDHGSFIVATVPFLTDNYVSNRENALRRGRVLGGAAMRGPFRLSCAGSPRVTLAPGPASPAFDTYWLCNASPGSGSCVSSPRACDCAVASSGRGVGTVRVRVSGCAGVPDCGRRHRLHRCGGPRGRGAGVGVHGIPHHVAPVAKRGPPVPPAGPAHATSRSHHTQGTRRARAHPLRL